MPGHTVVPMSATLFTSAGAQPGRGDAGVERRQAPRIDLPFPATVRGLDALGDRFEEQVVLGSLSARGLYLRLRRPVHIGARLFIYVKLWLPEQGGRAGARVAMQGRVMRSEAGHDRRWGIAIVADRHRFLYRRRA